MRPEVWLFAGPSAHGTSLPSARSLRWLPPARRGDIYGITVSNKASPPGVIVLCDGIFGSDPAVSHGELCRALDAGWQVWGCSSMGAIRAYELRHEGMRGWGWVYQQFRRHQDFRDDELALLHLPVPPYTPITEALVNLRWALRQHGPALGITPRTAQRVVGWLQELWFGERSLELIFDLMVGPAGVPAHAACRLLDEMVANPVKNSDLASLLRAQPWLKR